MTPCNINIRIIPIFTTVTAIKMNRALAVILFLFMCLPSVLASSLPPLVKTIPLSSVKGRIDHMAVDATGRRLFIAALGNNSVEVVDLKRARQIRSITDIEEPQGIVYDPDTNEIVVTSGGDGTCKFYDAQTYELLRTVNVGADADNVHLDAAANRLYVGGGNGQISALNAVNGTRIVGGDVALPEHPEGFQIETHGTRIFVNLSQSGSVAVLDRQTQSVTAIWKLDSLRGNFPMALDEPDHRLFVACRNPARLVVLDTDQGHVVASLPCVGDADDVFFDEIFKRIYVSGGEGYLDVFHLRDPSDVRVDGRLKTGAGARTCFYVEEPGYLYVAVPEREHQHAAIQVYDLRAK